MGNKQYLAITLSCIAVVVLYFCFDTSPPKMKSLEKSRLEGIESTGVSNLIADAMKHLDRSQSSLVEAMQMNLSATGQDTIQKIQALRDLSNTWLSLGYPAISGSYLDNIASLKPSALSWSDAGKMFQICLQNTEEEKVRQYCFERNSKAFENAISLDSENIDYRLNLAMGYVAMPPKDNPMKGILMLRELNTSHPNNINVLLQLGKLAMNTNQWDKATQRFEQVLDIDSENMIATCLLGETYSKIGLAEKAEAYILKCNK